MDTKIYMGPRGCGKTTILIMKSAETGATIIAPSRYMAEQIWIEVNKKGFIIPYLLSIDEFMHMMQNPLFYKTNLRSHYNTFSLHLRFGELPLTIMTILNIWILKRRIDIYEK